MIRVDGEISCRNIMKPVLTDAYNGLIKNQIHIGVHQMGFQMELRTPVVLYKNSESTRTKVVRNCCSVRTVGFCSTKHSPATTLR